MKAGYNAAAMPSSSPVNGTADEDPITSGIPDMADLTCLAGARSRDPYPVVRASVAGSFTRRVATRR